MEMKQIELTQGQYAIVDDEDYDKVIQFNWYASYSKHTNSFYALRHPWINKKQTTETMHQFIFKNKSNKKQIDHINHNTLDNRKENLRIVTSQQNQMNRKTHKKKNKGISWHKRDKFWTAQITFNKKNIWLGYFKTELEAKKAYNKKAKKLFGDYYHD